MEEKEFKTFVAKFEGYLWRCQAKELRSKLKNYEIGEMVDELAEKENKRNIEQLLFKCPLVSRAIKVREWAYLWEKMEPVEALEEKQIEEMMNEWLNKDLDCGHLETLSIDSDANDAYLTKLDSLKQFIHLAKLSVSSEKLNKQLQSLEQVYNLYNLKKFDNLEYVIESLIDSELWSNKVFEHLDSVLSTLKGVEKNAKNIQDLKNVLKERNCSFEDLKLVQRLEIENMKELLEKFKILPDVLCNNFMTSWQVIDSEVRGVETFHNIKVLKTEKELVKLFEIVKGKKLQTVISTYDSILDGYCEFAIVHPDIENMLINLATLIRANCLLEGKGFKNCRRDLTIWEGTYNDVKA